MNARAHVGFGCVVLVLAGCSDPHENSGPSHEPGVPRAVRELIDDAVANGFSGALLVTADGERLTPEAHGLADRDSATANTP
ncbi:MAG TPA: hypothetical protein VNN72_01255, partial [Polyangiaceae bacterium]|nr:hypothetical protein [Polyangiaceae bacterium]